MSRDPKPSIRPQWVGVDQLVTEEGRTYFDRLVRWLEDEGVVTWAHKSLTDEAKKLAAVEFAAYEKGVADGIYQAERGGANNHD